MKVYVHDALLAIAFWQILLVPYLLAWSGLTMAQYGRWCLGNIVVSAVAGPLFAGLLRWVRA